MSDLDGCKHCGGEPHRRVEDHALMRVVCGACGIATEADTDAKATAEWNARSPRVARALAVLEWLETEVNGGRETLACFDAWKPHAE